MNYKASQLDEKKLAEPGHWCSHLGSCAARMLVALIYWTSAAAAGLVAQPVRAAGKLVLLRHGQSAWNRENRFTGWVDVDLTERGIIEANAAQAHRELAKSCPPAAAEGL